MSGQQLALPGIRQLPRKPEWQQKCCGRLEAHCSNCPLKRARAQTRARRAGPETSKRAAEKATVFVASHEAKLFGAICDAGARGATYREIAASTGLEPVAVARRLGNMGERKLITRLLKAEPKNDHDYEARQNCAVWWRT